MSLLTPAGGILRRMVSEQHEPAGSLSPLALRWRPLLTPKVNHGTLYGGRESTVKSSLLATAGAKEPNPRNEEVLTSTFLLMVAGALIGRSLPTPSSLPCLTMCLLPARTPATTSAAPEWYSTAVRHFCSDSDYPLDINRLVAGLRHRTRPIASQPRLSLSHTHPIEIHKTKKVVSRVRCHPTASQPRLTHTHTHAHTYTQSTYTRGGRPRLHFNARNTVARTPESWPRCCAAIGPRGMLATHVGDMGQRSDAAFAARPANANTKRAFSVRRALDHARASPR